MIEWKSEQSRQEFEKLIALPHAPGSGTWKRLEDLTGYDGDYIPADVGQPIEER